MNFCISGNQPQEILSQANQIKFRYSDLGHYLDSIPLYPNAHFILEISPKDSPDIPLLESCASKAPLTLALNSLAAIPQTLPYYWNYPITTFYDLRSLLSLPTPPSYILIDAPLSFSLPKIKQITQIPLRLCPNLAYDPYIPNKNGIYGSWVRPEDTSLYSQYIDTFEFAHESLSQERVLFETYQKEYWPGNLNLLITNLKVNVDNRAIPEELGERRTKCGQRCMETPTCDLCATSLKYANAIRNLHYKNKNHT